MRSAFEEVSERITSLREENEAIKKENRKLKEMLSNPSKRKLLPPDASQPRKHREAAGKKNDGCFSFDGVKKRLIHVAMTGIVSIFVHYMPNLSSWVHEPDLGRWKPLSEKLTVLQIVEELFPMSNTVTNIRPGSFLAEVLDNTLCDSLCGLSENAQSKNPLSSVVDLPEVLRIVKRSWTKSRENTHTSGQGTGEDEAVKRCQFVDRIRSPWKQIFTAI